MSKDIALWTSAIVIITLANMRPLFSEEFLPADPVDHQPLASQAERILEAMEYVGSPLAVESATRLKEILKQSDSRKTLAEVQKTFDPLCLVGVTINAESRVSVIEGPASKELIQQGWRTFLVKVVNSAGINPTLKVECPNSAPIYSRSTGASEPKVVITPEDVPNRWAEVAMFDKQPLSARLSGLGLEYRLIQIYSRDAGQREAKLGFNVGQGTQDLGFRNSVPILFRALPAASVKLTITDFDGTPTTAALLIRDQLGRVYPNPARRLAPDFFFHHQIYRSSGETIDLPPGEYTVEVSRGPEYFVDSQKLIVPANEEKTTANFQLRRWVHAAKRGWYSGDHHVHAAGCAHYDNPTAGVTPTDMMRHILGEDLNVGCVLSWGPCWYAQKQYFEGKVSRLSTPDYLMRYDVEVSGFPSSHAGHLCLLRLTEDDYTGAERIEQWPSWTLPILAWGRKQGGIVGYSHSGWGLQLPDVMPNGSREYVDYRKLPANWEGKSASKLPDYELPKFDGIGANEFIVTTTTGDCEFISAVDTPAVWELNIWYHTLNCGMTTRISGETDFPCIYGERIGLGRIYCKLGQKEELTYDNWVMGLKNGRSYCGDGASHLFDFRVNNVAVGEPGSGEKISTLSLDAAGVVTVKTDVAALLASETPTKEATELRARRLDEKPYWHLERSRIGNTRQVPVEVIVNGQPVAKTEVRADGSVQSLEWTIPIKHSSWVALRIFPSVHTNPVWVEVGGQPVRASRRSAAWCEQAVDICWKAKSPKIRDSERIEAEQAYRRAKEIYARIEREAVAD